MWTTAAHNIHIIDNIHHNNNPAVNKQTNTQQDITQEINEMMGQSFAVPEDVDEADLMAELDALEADMAAEPAGGQGVPSYLAAGDDEQQLPELPAAPQAADAEAELGLPALRS